MGVELAAEAMQLVRDGMPASPLPMTRRHRWAPLFAQRGEHGAIVLLAARSRRRTYLVHLCFAAHGGSWDVTGSGHEQLERPFDSDRGIGDGSRRYSESYRSMGADAGWCRLRFTSEVARFDYEGNDHEVPPHGWCAVSWQGLRQPTITLFGEDGEELGTLTSKSFGPLHLRRGRRWHRRLRRFLRH